MSPLPVNLPKDMENLYRKKKLQNFTERHKNEKME
jgi:hypothetical protein